MTVSSKSCDKRGRVNKNKSLFQACIRLLCKNHKGEDTKCICIKPKAHAIGLSKDIYTLFPSSVHLYLYRHPAEYVMSVITVFKSLLHPVARSLLVTLSFAYDMPDFIMRQFADSGDQYQSIYQAKMLDSLRHINTNVYVKRFSALFCGNLLAMLQLTKEERIPILVISFHELKVILLFKSRDLRGVSLNFQFQSHATFD